MVRGVTSQFARTRSAGSSAGGGRRVLGCWSTSEIRRRAASRGEGRVALEGQRHRTSPGLLRSGQASRNPASPGLLRFVQGSSDSAILLKRALPLSAPACCLPAQRTGPSTTDRPAAARLCCCSAAARSSHEAPHGAQRTAAPASQQALAS